MWTDTTHIVAAYMWVITHLFCYYPDLLTILHGEEQIIIISPKNSRYPYYLYFNKRNPLYFIQQ